MKMIVLRLDSSCMEEVLGPCRRARPLRHWAVAVGGEPYQRGFHVVKQALPGARGRAAARDEYVIEAGTAMGGQQEARRLAQTPLGAVALHGPADSPRGGKSGADQGLIVAGQRLDEHRAPGEGGALRTGEEL